MSDYIHTDGRTLKLGKHIARKDPKSLQFSKYAASLPSFPPICNWYGNVKNWGMMENDVLSDCTCAAYGHGAQVITHNTPIGLVTPPDILIQLLYERSCGYVPGQPDTDQGGEILTVLQHTNQFGLGRKNVKHEHHHQKFPLHSFSELDICNFDHFKQAVATFCTVDIGIQLPISAQSQVGSLWDVVGNSQVDQPGGWGGHSVIVCAYSPTTITCITWGQLQEMTYAFWKKYVDEAYVLLYNAWFERFAGGYPAVLAQLEKDLTLV